MFITLLFEEDEESYFRKMNSKHENTILLAILPLKPLHSSILYRR
jgi:hypothetical protein